MRFMLYSHDGFGLGHTSRNLAIARALTQLQPDAAVLLATGSDDVTRLGVPDRVEILKLPGLRKIANEHYGARHLAVSEGEARRLRSRLLHSTVATYRPDVLLVDKHPFGAGGELRDALTVLREHGGKAVLGLRDILDDPATVRCEWEPHELPQVIPLHYESVLVYGQSNVFDTAGAYGFTSALHSRTYYCGYISHSAEVPLGNGIASIEVPADDPEHPLILATVGGGEDGFHLLENFLMACSGERWRAVAIAGPMMPEAQHTKLTQLAHEIGAELHSFVPGLGRWFAAAGAVVCMGGYNTITQTLQAASPVICVPRTEPRREQIVRAEAAARLGLLSLLPPAELDPTRLRKEIKKALTTPRDELRGRIQALLRFDGAETAAGHLITLAIGIIGQNQLRPTRKAVS